ncbi:hypothetical protein PIB30_052540 [Stylosanthes scabra]|uniref:Uncharacterized protein n=1 Tax=Stylosanthes scabra TaxID=79078 RepID=A0ABU6RI73_9FABA|nr:hypothetical protein [Stylosanthes scabra]
MQDCFENCAAQSLSLPDCFEVWCHLDPEMYFGVSTGGILPPLKMAILANQSVHEFLSINNSSKSTLCIEDRNVWKPAPPNVTTLNCDASVFSN